MQQRIRLNATSVGVAIGVLYYLVTGSTTPTAREDILAYERAGLTQHLQQETLIDQELLKFYRQSAAAEITLADMAKAIRSRTIPGYTEVVASLKAFTARTQPVRQLQLDMVENRERIIALCRHMADAVENDDVASLQEVQRQMKRERDMQLELLDRVVALRTS
jgi:hypothetical protein